MDEIDIKILERLQQNGRISFSQLARELHLSSPRIAERKLLIIIQAGELKVPCGEFEKKIKEEPAILECHRVTGSDSYFMKVAVPSMKELEQLVDKFTPISRFCTSVVLSSPVTGRIILPPEDVENG
ncbi:MULTISPECIES: Lrp/AsnC family transcriptional regulator [unclassified Thermoactinomyces]|jgi:Lrp/AsnC family transcriptional regulator, leucine-responsive regulatory protein|uniref:Lrp/AsnC family transcriptional regulator n=1 Tax=unclassified Thermoactinomyces TaxID=2634588 RepID=UPI0018DBC129|nr:MULTISPECIES: Lrp/AsnC family transcriptional regulator [unclassified Thermoactinomyces]MBH8599258.1 Lrp/AsnC family transcriptional regulator [Thermoactinomyces sp. CICC 10523]MBH8609292.1 Lrp/AsnC family transcriptional regulator [Thermoactinomyces sp. CICC 10521]